MVLKLEFELQIFNVFIEIKLLQRTGYSSTTFADVIARYQ